MSELKVEMMNRKQLQNEYNRLGKQQIWHGPTEAWDNFVNKATKNPNWKHIKVPTENNQKGVY